MTHEKPSVVQGHISAIRRRSGKGVPPVVLAAAELTEEAGLLGDPVPAAGAPLVSLLDETVRAWMLSLPQPGLCFQQFTENLLLCGVQTSALRPGDRLKFETALLEVVSVGKACYPACALLMQNTPCRLAAGAAFAKVIRSGVVRTGDGFTVVPGVDPAGRPQVP